MCFCGLRDGLIVSPPTRLSDASYREFTSPLDRFRGNSSSHCAFSLLHMAGKGLHCHRMEGTVLEEWRFCEYPNVQV